MEKVSQDGDANFFDESRHLIAEINTEIRQSILEKHAQTSSVIKGRQLRHQVNRLRAEVILHKLNKFQEWPQLLDPLLVGEQRLLELLSSALLANVEICLSSPERQPKRIQKDGWSMSTFVCTVLYTLCKLRGHKVVSRSFNNERDKLSKVIEYFLHRKLRSEKIGEPVGEDALVHWEETYVLLLWLALLVTIPFPLAAVDDGSIHADSASSMPLLPPQLPIVCHDILKIAVSHIISPSKDREASAILLARLITRPDMQLERLHETFVSWALEQVRTAKPLVEPWPHSVIGWLSFLAAFAKIAPEEILSDQAQAIWGGLIALLDEGDTLQEHLRDSAAMTQLLLKIFRTTCSRMFDLGMSRDPEALQWIIGFLFECSGDNMSATRFAASKALGQIALSEKKHNNSQVMDYLFESLEDDVDWEDMIPTKDVGNAISEPHTEKEVDFRSLEHGFAVADQALWHGYTMTLAHMLLAQAVPLHQLSRSCTFISVALSFFQRSPSGVASGENVRDAACLCVWALARKYTTTQIQLSDKQSASPGYDSLQCLVVELLKAACLDSTNNIRRAASAASQELIGRHPDTITRGREISFTVDVQAVASKTSGFLQTAFKVSLLAEDYHNKLIECLCNSRGILHPDTSTRKLAAQSLGLLAIRTIEQVGHTVNLLRKRLLDTHATERAWRHGLLMSIAHVIDADDECHQAYRDTEDLAVVISQDIIPSQSLSPGGLKVEHVAALLECLNHEKTEYQKHQNLEGDFILESICTFLRAVATTTNSHGLRLEDVDGLSTSDMDVYVSMAKCGLTSLNGQIRDLAAEAVLALLTVVSQSIRQRHADDIVHHFHTSGSTREQLRIGYITLLGFLFTSNITGSAPVQTEDDWRPFCCSTLHEQTTSDFPSINRRCAAVRSIIRGPLSSNYCNPQLLSAIRLSLNDYTYIDQGGDIGSALRIDAIEAATMALRRNLVPKGQQREELIIYLCALATESLDRVRFKASTLLQEHWDAFGLSTIAARPNITNTIDTTVPAYFLPFLQIATTHPSGKGLEIFHGFVTSASSTSNPSLCHSARTALLQHLSTHPNHFPQILQSLSGFKHEGVTLPPQRRPERLRRAWVECVAFLLETYLVEYFAASDDERGEKLASPKFFHNLFAATTRSHYQSRDLRLLEAAVGVYYALAAYLPAKDGEMNGYGAVRKEALEKLIAMLSGPFARIRDQAADALFLVLEDEKMLTVGFGGDGGKEERARLKMIVAEGTW